MKKYIVMVGLLFCFSGLAPAAPMRTHVMFSDHMVLQRDMNVPVWGYAVSGTVVTVQLDGVTVGTATANASGKWLARIGSHTNDGGVAHVLLISAPGETNVQINDVVFGDVYLASGQSNMDRTMAVANGLNEEKLVCGSYVIRQIDVSNTMSSVKLEEPELVANWTNCTSANLNKFSANAYFFAKYVYETTGVPVGLLSAAYGGMEIEFFISPSGMAAVPELSGFYQDVDQGGGFIGCYEIYNAMIAPMVPYGMRGVIWNQGEQNAGNGDREAYWPKQLALFRGWRQEWGLGNIPFYYVQLPNFVAATDRTSIRWAQQKALAETNTGMVVTIDIGDPGDIHPANKRDVGYREAQWALVKEFNQNKVFSGPLYRSSAIEGSQMRIIFDYADGGLLAATKNGTNSIVPTANPLQDFEIAGSNKTYFSATAVIDRDTVILSNTSSVPSPVYARYKYANSPSGTNNLYNTAGFPAGPFRTEEFFPLTVKSGTGSGQGKVPGTVVTITASAAPGGKVFDRWIGAASEINNPNASPAQVTMPTHPLYLLATYRNTAAPVYTLSVSNGFGSGTSQTGSVLNIKAYVAPAGKIFDHWEGNTQTVVNVSAAVTTLRMPAGNVSVTAVYRTIDRVGDGISDAWRALYFGGDGTTTNSQSAVGADPDADGSTNLQEYRAGTSPLDGQSVLRLAGAFSGSGASLNFRSVTGLRYRLETTASLTSPSWMPLLYNITGDGMQKQTGFSIGPATNGFYRLRLITE